MITDPFEQLDNPLTLTKYKDAGKITAIVLESIPLVPNKSVHGLCETADKLIIEEVKKIYPEIKHKGICFPTCISVNNMVGNFSPSSQNDYMLKEGDVAKIELGVHIDGFPARVCTTVYIGDKMSKETGQLFTALSEMGKSVVQLFKDKQMNTTIVETMKQIAEKYNCSIATVNDGIFAPGTTCYQMSRNVIDGRNDDDDEFVHQLIINRTHPNAEITLFKQELLDREVYCVDIALTLNDKAGLLSRADNPTTVYKRNFDEKTKLKLKCSMGALNTFRTRFPVSMRNNTDNRIRLGLKECISKKTVEEYAVYKDKYTVGRTMFTVIVDKEPILIAGRSLDNELKKIEI
jgi:methionine aminopeptidase